MLFKKTVPTFKITTMFLDAIRNVGNVAEEDQVKWRRFSCMY